MKLISATIENYRIHKSRRIDFDDARTLIGEPNECGKSTLVEAIHRTLFFRHSAGGEVQADMTSSIHGGTPTVELDFEAEGKRYHLRKEFGGTKGRVTLNTGSEQGLSGDEAESELARLLGTGGPISGRGAAGQLNTQWSHLWIWQGNSASNPADRLGDVSASLIDRLQESGGAVALQSALDGKLAAEVSDRLNAIYSGRGARAGSAEKLAESAKAEAAQAVESARERVEATRRDAERVVQAEQEIARHTASLDGLREQVQALQTKLKTVEVLQAELKDRQREYDVADQKWANLDKADKRIQALSRDAEALRLRLEPEKERIEATRKAMAEAVAKRHRTQAELDKAGESVEDARLLKEYAGLLVDRFRCERDLASREATLKSVRKTQASLEKSKRQLARLPEIETRDLTTLRKLEQAVIQARSTLEAIATDIEIIASEGPVTLNDEALEVGNRRAIDEPSELSLGNARLRIIPGGGKGLEEARQNLATTEEKLREKLQSFVLDSVEAAGTALTERDSLKAEIRAQEKQLETLDHEQTLKEHERLGHERESLNAKREALAEKVVSPPGQPTSLDQAEQLADDCETAYRKVRESMAEKRSSVTTSVKRAGKLEEDLARQSKAHQESADTLSGMLTELRVLRETHGSDDHRAEALQSASQSRQAAEQHLQATCSRLQALDPEQLKADKDRLERSEQETTKALQQARDDRSGAQGRLATDGREDPQEALAIAEARLETAREAHEREVRIREALQLLNDTFAREQASLSEQFSQPLADRITVYLQALFGKEARAKVTFQDNQLAGIKLLRDSTTGAFSFDALSGGTREQVGAAVRLAIAEILAASHGGCLPVVFDDSFAYSDPDRVQELQRMLDQAARNGLQVIILSCNPADYAALGARHVAIG
jgi:DNA repair exonuclease SbcCD ATPase subunit